MMDLNMIPRRYSIGEGTIPEVLMMLFLVVIAVITRVLTKHPVTRIRHVLQDCMSLGWLYTRGILKL
ncbi:hypothetical protein BDV10DRAFT_155944, partial [Aspergillus recurvatus]